MEQNRDFSEQILDTLRAELTAASLESDRFIATLESIGKKAKELIHEAKRKQDVPFEIQKILLEISNENSKRADCLSALETIEKAIRDLQKSKTQRELDYEWKLDGLKEHFGKRQ